MSDMSISSSTNVGATASTKSVISTSNVNASGGSTSATSTNATGLTPARPPAGDSVTPATGLETSNRSESTYGATTSTMSMTLEQVDQNKMSTFVLALIAALFGDKKKKDDEDAGTLLGMLMLSAMQQPTISQMSYTESFTSQISQTSSATSTNAVQATPYSSEGGGSGSAGTGARLNTSA
ncbi:MAG: hypothetical protein IPK83_10135 [Planctomycetes bacterium]|nr:hypothetical protein [Planctomycetota bacterium]